jgi:riboflavin synthase
MFTGIVEEVGHIQSVEPGGLTFRASEVMSDLKVSDSINVNGTCLTVTSRDEHTFSVDVVPETLRRTNLGSLGAGDPVDLERPLAVDGRFGGHIVQGHVDATGTLDSISEEGDALLLRFLGSASIMRYVVEKGFIAVDGVSLTVVNCDERSFTVTIIPFTRDNTVLGSKKVGEPVNLEADIIAKYVERLHSGPPGHESS